MGWRLTFLAAVAIVAITGVAFAASGGSSGTITVCAQKSGGALTLASKGKCGKGQRKLTISKEGPAGATGAAGSPGAPGAPGTTASIQPEAMHLVTETGSEVPPAYCQEHPGTFCWEGPLNWVNGSAGEPAHAGFQKDAAGYVHLQGFAEVTGGSGPPPPPVIFYLPPGDRPTDGTHTFLGIPGCSSAPPSTVEISTNGAVKGGVCATLDGITFHP